MRIKNKFITALRLLSGSIKYPFVKLKYPLPKILSIDESLEHVVNSNCSVARFGDSEYLYLTGNSDGLQSTNKDLKEALKRVLKNTNPNLLVCLVDYNNISDRTFRAKTSGKMFHCRTIKKYHKLLNFDYVFGNSNMTRFYMGMKNKDISHIRFEMCKRIWDGRDIILFEGEKTRFGYGNDLFDNASSIKRVICPSKEAYGVYPQILSYAKTLDNRNLLIFALGTTATVAASDLTDEGFQVIDIGNLDVEYEWFKKGATKVIAIPNKQVSETSGGTKVGKLDDDIYLNQIIYKIGVV